MKRILALLLAGIALAACGSSPAAHHPALHRCSTSDFAMQCYHPPSGLKVAPPTGALFARGIDFAWGGPSASRMRANGWTFGASYLSTDYSKNWTTSLVNSYHANGISTVVVWETTSTRATQGYAAGASDARSARAQDYGLAGHRTRPIYFAIDCDCSYSQVSGYFQGADSVLGVKRVGAYGGYRPISALLNSRLITYAWQTYAWSGGLLDSRAQLYQNPNGSSFDYDRAFSSDYGQAPFTPPKPPPPPKPVDPHHYLRFSTWERPTVEAYDGARAHPLQFAAYLKNVLEPRLLWDAKQVAHAARAGGVCIDVASCAPRWDLYFRWYREQQLLDRSKGQRLA